MGWLDCHLHRFRVLDPGSGTAMLLGIPDSDVPNDLSVAAGWMEFPLDFTAGDLPPMHYTYDFGDNWDHAVIFEGFEQAGGPRTGPECVGGAGACPPEDSGGSHGYANLLAALADPGHPEHRDSIEWAPVGRLIQRPFLPPTCTLTILRSVGDIAFEGGATRDQL